MPDPTPAPSGTRWISRKQLAAKTSLSLRSIDRAVAKGLLPRPVRVAGRRLWREQDIDRALARLEQEQGQSDAASGDK